MYSVWHVSLQAQLVGNEMRSQANRNYVSNDNVDTPLDVAKRIVEYFKPTGRILEPCKGSGNFLSCLPERTMWCELKEGRDFFDFMDHVDWIITNPPWSKMRKFLKHSMEIADNVCFLMTINHVWTKARLRDMRDFGFGIREIIMIDTPSTFQKFGFQVGVVHFKRGHYGDIKLTDWRSD